MDEKILNLLVRQFEDKHKQSPVEIVVHPVALAALTLRQSIAQKWNGIPVKCEEIKPQHLPTQTIPNRLGIVVINGALRGIDLH